jgi:hypothetical protein
MTPKTKAELAAEECAKSYYDYDLKCGVEAAGRSYDKDRAFVANIFLAGVRWLAAELEKRAVEINKVGEEGWPVEGRFVELSAIKELTGNETNSDTTTKANGDSHLW